MAKGVDAVTRKKNKARRKKLEKENSSVSARVASIIAAKKRRQSGKRRMCQGMCFSLPTPEDPFNDRHAKKDFNRKDIKKNVASQAVERVIVKGKTATLSKETISGKDAEMNNLEQNKEKAMNLRGELKKSLSSGNNLGLKSSVNHKSTKIQMNGKAGCDHERQACENADCPSKFLVLCLNAIEKALRDDGTYNNDEDKPLFANHWGVEFLKFYSIGKDILETSGFSCTIEQIAWVVSIAADTIARKEKEGLSFNSPFLLFLVPSQEKAAQVRLVCKPLKALGIHTVSLHTGASIDHQIHGLKSCEPEFLVSTPQRLLELVSLKAIDISGVSFVVVDGLEFFYKDGCLDALKSIRQSISGNPHTVVFNNFFSYACVLALQNLLLGSIFRLSLNNSIPSQSACIVQAISVCTSDEEKVLKGIEVLQHAHGNQLYSQPVKVLYAVREDSNFCNLAKTLKLNGYSVSTGSNCNISDVENCLDSNSRMKSAVSIINTEHISDADLSAYEIVILPNFVDSIDNYVQILTRMARHTINGILYSFLTKEDAVLAGPLIEILEQCGQTVPKALRKLHITPSMVES